MFWNGRHSDRCGERPWHLSLPLLASGVLLIAGLGFDSKPLAYLCLTAAVGLNWAVTPVFWAVTTEYLSGGAAAASAIALINATANLAGVGLPPVIGYLRDHTGNYHSGLLLVGTALVAGGLLGFELARRVSPAPARRL